METQQNYIENRLLKQQKWFSSKSTKQKLFYTITTTLIVVFSSAIPIIIILNNSSKLDILIAILGGLIALLTSFETIFNFKQNWILYRSVSESLKSEYFLFMSEKNNSDEEFKLFVNKVEKIILEVNTSWVKILKSNTNGK